MTLNSGMLVAMLIMLHLSLLCRRLLSFALVYFLLRFALGQIVLVEIIFLLSLEEATRNRF